MKEINIENMSAEDLMYLLALKIAADQFEINHRVYKEDSESYANDGVTESAYMKDAIETVDWFCDEQLVETVLKNARSEYERLVKQKYAK